MNLAPPLADLQAQDVSTFPGGPWGWRQAMPVDPRVDPVTLGEGNTPLVQLDAGAGELHLKMEGSNPTGSHKDRAMAVGVAKAVEMNSPVVIVASSGNAGAAAAAYAARAGLTCVVTASSGLAPALEAQIVATGARLALFETSEARTNMTRRAVETLGWFPLANYVLPAAGGNPYANEGYKSIAYELARDIPDADVVVVPTCRADVLSGISRGYNELVRAGLLSRTPRLVAAETSTGAAFTLALTLPARQAQERASVDRTDSPAFSIGSDNACWQGLEALWASDGWAVALDPVDYLAETVSLARDDGVFIEVSSAVAVLAARHIARAMNVKVVALTTASGLKDPSWVKPDPSRPVLENPSIDQLADLPVASARG